MNKGTHVKRLFIGTLQFHLWNCFLAAKDTVIFESE